MAIGPVQLIVLGFNHPDFHGEVIAELERLRASDTVRVIDALAVYKDQAGELEVEHLSNMTQEEAVSLIVNGFCKEVLQTLPMEFAVEAQKLVGMSAPPSSTLKPAAVSVSLSSFVLSNSCIPSSPK